MPPKKVKTRKGSKTKLVDQGTEEEETLNVEGKDDGLLATKGENPPPEGTTKGKGKKGKGGKKKKKKAEEDDEKPKFTRVQKVQRKRAAKQIGRLVTSWHVRKQLWLRFRSMIGLLALDSYTVQIVLRVAGEAGMGAKNLGTAEKEIISFREWQISHFKTAFCQLTNKVAALRHRDIEIQSVYKPKLKKGQKDQGEYMIRFMVLLKEFKMRNRFIKRVYRICRDTSKTGLSQTFKTRCRTIHSHVSILLIFK